MKISRGLLLASTILSGLAIGGAALAQAQTSSGATNSTTSVQELIVTGSRIPAANLTSVQPVTTLSGTDIQQRGITNIADAINQIPITGSGITPMGDQNSFGVAVNYVDLFDLGSQHSLTLVSGYRYVTDNPTNIFANNGGTQVDLNDLPTLFIDRTEIVPATGAAVYGTDAVAGVVNVIMKKRYVGAEINVQGGWSTYGDDPHYTVEGAIGHELLDGKLNVAVDFMWDQTSNVLDSARPWSAIQHGFVPNPDPNAGANGIPASILVFNTRISGVNEWGIPFSASTGNPYTLPGSNTIVQFTPGGNLVPYNTGTLYGSCFYGIVFCSESGGDGLNLAPLETLQTGYDRKVATGMVSYDFSDHLHFHGSFNYTDVSATSLDQPNYAYIGFGFAPAFNAPFPGSSILVAPDNAFLTPQALAILNANGLQTDGGFYLSRSNQDVASAPFSGESKTYNVNFELTGDFSILHHAFNWTADWERGENWSRFDTPNIVYGNPAVNVPDLFGYALDSVVGPGGQPVCRVTLQNPGSSDPYVSGCVPFNPFASPASNAASIKYFTADFGEHSINQLDDGQINVWTNVFKLPAGNVRVSVGYEYHRDAAGFTPSLASEEGIGYSVPFSSQHGSEVSNEYYVEGALPLLGPGFNFPGAYRFELTGAYRHVDNSLAGANEAWNFGGQFSPIPDITLRGSRSKTFSAPPLTDLFAAQTSAFDSGADPCQASNITAGPNPAVRQANCAKAFTALGADLATFNNSIVGQQTIPITAGGNPDLKAETGNSWTYGVLVQPRWIPGLSISADFIEIDISNLIEFAGIGTLLEQCYDTPNYPSASCADFTRQPGTGQVVTANETYINAGYDRYTGMEYKLDYVRDVNALPFVHTDRDLGRMNFDLDVVNNRRNVVSVTGLGFDAINEAGVIAQQPRWRWIARFGYEKGPFRFGWTTHFISDSYYDLTFTANNQLPLKVGRSYVHDLSLAYKIVPKLTLTLNINNITNEAPPFPLGNAGDGFYDFIGRYYTLAVSSKF